MDSMNQKQLKDLIQEGESNTVEFKESLKLHNRIGEAVSGLSNSKGGIIIVGTQEAELPPLTSGTALEI